MSATALSSFAPDLTGSQAGPEAALLRQLQQLRSLLEWLPAPVYQARPAPRVSGTIGGHVRHCLDHVAALVSSRDAGELFYDRRQRGTLVESDPDAAIDAIDRLMDGIGRLAGSLNRPVDVFSMLDRHGVDVAARSTVAREVAFVVHHTTHHFAIIALLLDIAGWNAPEGFGLAPSTPTLH
jgi:hypothetical protein